MSIDPMTSGAWIVAVDGEDVRLDLTFREGVTFEAGMPVGRYEQAGSSFIVTIGEEVRLVVDLAGNPDELPARMLTKHDGDLLDERASLFRADWN
jgi:hypothetical protein